MQGSAKSIKAWTSQDTINEEVESSNSENEDENINKAEKQGTFKKYYFLIFIIGTVSNSFEKKT